MHCRNLDPREGAGCLASPAWLGMAVCSCRLTVWRAAAGRAPQGKLDTESLLKERDVNWTSVRPVYMCASVEFNPTETQLESAMCTPLSMCLLL